MNIEDELFPNRNRLNTENETATAQIVDAELDFLHCSFHFDEAVEIDTSTFNHISLTIDNLRQLIDLINESEEYYKKQS